VDDIDGDNLPTLIYSLNRRNAWSSFQIDLRSRTTPSFPRAFAPACRQALLGPGYGIAGIQNPCQHQAPTVNLDARHAQRASAAKRRARRRHSGTLAPTPTPLRCGDFVRAHGSTAPHV
jgi:hypothetical protein